MFAFIFVLSIFGCAFGAPRKFDGRIVGGADTNITEVPYQISLLLRGGHYCGGSILNENTILTAGHCVWVEYVPSDFSIRAGSSYNSREGQVIGVKEIIYHPKYNVNEDLDYDIVILKLESNLVFGPGVAPAKLPKHGLIYPGGTKAVVSGWGALSFQGSYPSILQKVTVPMVTVEECSIPYGGVSERQVCAGAEGRDACQGDSGGPLVVNDEVIGIVSWGYACAYDGYPTVYTSVSEFIPFINEHLN